MGLSFLKLFGLFGGTFLSATFVPFVSDVLLLGAYESGVPVIPALLIATAGNLLGGLTNYFIGYWANYDKLSKRYKINREKLDRWEGRLQKRGAFLGLFSWVPVIGEPMTATMGFFKVPFWPLLFMMLIGKFGRYTIVTLVYLIV